MTTENFRLLMISILIVVCLIWGWRAAFNKNTGKKSVWILSILMIITTIILSGYIGEFKKAVEECWNKPQTQRKGEDVVSSVNYPYRGPVLCEWYWRLDHGFMHGRRENPSNERVGEVVPTNDGSIMVEIHYMEYGEPEIERIRIYKVGDHHWKGTRDQNSPEEHCYLDLDEVDSGAFTVFSGRIVWQYPRCVGGICHIKIKK